jgi:hypothetical protein
MPLVLADRVRETTTTTGTGTISLAGPVSGFQGFSTAIGNANTTYYTIVDAATGAWEVGLGTYTSSGSTLARTTVLSSSNSDALVPFASGTKDVFVTQPAERAVYVLGAGTGLAAGAAAFTANGVPYASATNTLTTGSALTFDGTRLTSTTGKFGGGVALNSASLMVNNATNTATGIQLFQDGIESWIMGMPANNAGLAWSASGSEQMRLTSTGLGIGAISPLAKLDVVGGNGDGIQYRTGTRTVGIGQVASEAAVYWGSTTALTFFSGSERARITSNGSFQLGSSTVSDPRLFVYDNDATDAAIVVRQDGAAAVQIWQGSGAGELARITSAGNLGIGTISPATKLHVNTGAAGYGITIAANSQTGTTYQLGIDSNSSLAVYDTNVASQRLVLSNAGNLGIGTSSPVNKLVVSNAGASGFEFDPTNSLMQTYNRSGAAYTAMNLLALSILFKTGASPATTMTLDSSGNLGLGVTPSAFGGAYRGFQIGGNPVITGANAPDICGNAYHDGTNWRYIGTTFAARYSVNQNNGGIHAWFNAASGTAGDAITFAQAMTLDASGNLLVGQTSWAFANNGTQIAASGRIFNTSNTDYNMELAGSTNARLRFYSSAGGSGTTVGSITVDTTNTQYNTSSDYRLKNITGPITTSGAYIDSLNPVEGTWKIDGSTFVGLIAHEVQKVSRTKVATGVKDGPDMQGMAYSSAEIIANLIAELQSLRRRVAQLEGTQP